MSEDAKIIICAIITIAIFGLFVVGMMAYDSGKTTDCKISAIQKGIDSSKIKEVCGK